MPTRELIDLLDGWQSRRIVVAGDFLLDRYIYGHADRLSPDAPVPVLAVQREEPRPGGAANVCLDLRALRCEVVTLGVIGRDPAGDELRAALEEAGCDTAGLLEADDRPTTVKHSLVGLAQHRHPQKMFRLDIEKKTPLGEKLIERLLAAAAAALEGADVLCLEDYAKGVLGEGVSQKLIALARERGIPVMVDPAAIEDYRRYRGATCITPNRTEASLATGIDASGADEDELVRMGRKLLRELELEKLLLTLDKQGVLLLERGRRPRMVPTRTREVYDVTGAGDMVLAMLAGAVANGAAWPQAVELANTAAGLEVEKFGVVPIELGEVLLALLRRDAQSLGKQRSLEHLLVELAAHRQQGKRIAFTNGCFDILHAGHVQYLRQARQAGDLLVVGLNSDDSIRRIKGDSRPVNREEDRVLVLSELESVDYVVVFGEDTPRNLIEAIRPDALVKGADYTRETVVGHEIVEQAGGEVVLVPLVKGRSTTNIIRRLESGEAERS
ncbi:MAG: D-glycero-beta-D-manno-heptose 1-phosphate adenylyltransferase [Phycisphaeraceae bacterium]